MVACLPEVNRNRLVSNGEENLAGEWKDSGVAYFDSDPDYTDFDRSIDDPLRWIEYSEALKILTLPQVKTIMRELIREGAKDAK